MCVSIEYNGEIIETMDAARRIFGDDNVVTSGKYALSAYLGNGCLCPLDVHETARAVNCRAVPSDDPMWFIFKPRKRVRESEGAK